MYKKNNKQTYDNDDITVNKIIEFIDDDFVLEIEKIENESTCLEHSSCEVPEIPVLPN